MLYLKIFLNRFKMAVLILAKVLLCFAVAVSALWCSNVLYYLLPGIPWLQMVAPAAFISLWVLLFLFVPKRRFVLAGYVVSVLLVCSAWMNMRASNDHNWLPEYSRIARMEKIDDDRILLHDLRDFSYHGTRENFTENYQTVTYDLRDIEGMDFALSYWDDNTLIAHTMLVFRFRHGPNVVVSAETRREAGEPWDVVRGFFNQYELIYVVGTEPDLLGRRIQISNEDVFLYPSVLDQAASREVFMNVMGQINDLQETPRFYNTLTQNCTSSLVQVARHKENFHWSDLSLLLNGASDKLLISRGAIEKNGTYWESKFAHYISPKGKHASRGEFSKAIRSAH